MTSDDRSFLNWLAMALAVAALVLGFFALGRVGSSGEQAAGAGGGTGGRESAACFSFWRCSSWRRS